MTLRIETALTGIAGLKAPARFRETASRRSRLFLERTDLYCPPAGQRTAAQLRPNLPPGSIQNGSDLDGPGRIYMWTVGFAPNVGTCPEYVTPEGEKLPRIEQGAYLRTVQDWIVRPQIKGVLGVAGVDSIGGYVKQYTSIRIPRTDRAQSFVAGTWSRPSKANNVAAAPISSNATAGDRGSHRRPARNAD